MENTKIKVNVIFAACGKRVKGVYKPKYALWCFTALEKNNTKTSDLVQTLLCLLICAYANNAIAVISSLISHSNLHGTQTPQGGHLNNSVVYISDQRKARKRLLFKARRDSCEMQ